MNNHLISPASHADANVISLRVQIFTDASRKRATVRNIWISVFSLRFVYIIGAVLLAFNNAINNGSEVSRVREESCRCLFDMRNKLMHIENLCSGTSFSRESSLEIHATPARWSLESYKRETLRQLTFPWNFLRTFACQMHICRLHHLQLIERSKLTEYSHFIFSNLRNIEEYFKLILLSRTTCSSECNYWKGVATQRIIPINISFSIVHVSSTSSTSFFISNFTLSI